MSKTIGDLSEITFMLKAKKIGFSILTPYSSVSKYDFVIDNGINLLKIQVKSTTQKDHRNRYKILLSHGRSVKEMYDKKDVDFFAIHIQNEDLFYIIPISAITTKTVSLYPYKKGHVLNKYLERWDLLE